MAEKYAKRYHVGLGNVGSYQVSARPWVSSSIHVPKSGVVDTAANRVEVNFPYVTKFITVRNDGPNTHGATMRVGFSENGMRDSTNNYFILSGGESFSADFKVTRMYIMGHDASLGGTTASVIAGLTGIEADLLSGSWNGMGGV